MVLNPHYALELTYGAFLNHSYQEPQPRDLDSETLGWRLGTRMFKKCQQNRYSRSLRDHKLSEHSMGSGFESSLPFSSL